MVKFDDVTKENIKEDNPNWPQISNHQYRKLIAGGSGFRKTNSLFNLISYQPDIDKPKYQLFINKRGSTGSKLIECLNDMDYIYKTIAEYNPNKVRKILIQFDDVIADMLSKKLIQQILNYLLEIEN